MYTRIRAFSTSLLELIDKPLKADIKQSFRPLYRIVVGTLPVVVVSILSDVMAPFMCIMTVFLLYRYMLPVQDDLAEITAGEVYFFGMSLYAYLTLWAVLLHVTGHTEQIARTVGLEFIVIWPTITPIYLNEKKRTNKDRRLKLQDYYPVFGALAIILHCITIWGFIK